MTTQTSVMPQLGNVDDLQRAVPATAPAWVKFRLHPVTQRVSNVCASLLIAAVLLIIVNLAFVERNIRCATHEDCQRLRRLNTVLVGMRSFLNVFILLVLVFVVLAQIGIDTRALMASAGVLGLIVGFGAQSFIKSFFTGMQIIASGRYSIGDYVVFDLLNKHTARGFVSDFTLQTTTLQDVTGARYFVGNGDVLLVTNYSMNDQLVQVNISISHAHEIDAVMQHFYMLALEMGVDQQLLHKVSRPPIVKGIVASTPETYTVGVAAVVYPTMEQEVERHMRQYLLTRLQALGIDATAGTTHAKPKPPMLLQLAPTPQTERDETALVIKNK